MAWSYFIDVPQRTVFSLFSDAITPQDVHEETEAVKNDPQFDPTFNQMVDASRGKPVSDFPADKVREFATSSIYDPTSRRALVMNGDLAFGLARMFTTYREIRGDVSLQVFRNREEALRWLEIREPSNPSRGSAPL